eukprot:6173349-Pleurochrysis_carterae.AAC.3
MRLVRKRVESRSGCSRLAGPRMPRRSTARRACGIRPGRPCANSNVPGMAGHRRRDDASARSMQSPCSSMFEDTGLYSVNIQTSSECCSARASSSGRRGW